MKLDVHQLENTSSKENKTELVQKEQQEFKLVGRAKYNRSLKTFSLNTKTKELKEAVIESSVKMSKYGGVTKENKIVTEKDCVYFQALNFNNALRKVTNKIG